MDIALLIYLLLINAISTVVFVRDKQLAKKTKRRTPEKTLHLLELAGGVFAIIQLMYIIHHKSRKRSYFLWTYFFLLLWLVFLFVFYVL